MHIFPAEIAAGLSERMANNSIAYQVLVSEFDPTKIKVNATVPGSTDPDLFRITSILASTGRNLNDDVFTREDLWKAKGTVVNKRINEEHNDDSILGVMTSSYVVDDNGEPVAEDTNVVDLPESFHVVDDGFLWSYWKDEDRNEYVQSLIASIRNGEYSVSMECIFNNFDYALWNDEEEFVVPRTEETSFLTSCLRIYEGEGKYKNYSVGRVLRDFTFSGKGIVKTPANPNSWILSTSSMKRFSPKKIISDINFSQSCVLDSEGDNLMSDEFKSKYESAVATIDGLKKEVDSLKATIVDNQKKANEEMVAEANKKISTLESSVASLNENVEKKTADLSIANSTIENLNAQIKELETAKSNLEAEIKKIHDEAAEAAKKDKMCARKNSLTCAGLSDELAEAEVIKWENVSDDCFNTYVASLKPAATASVTSILDDTDKVEPTVPAQSNDDKSATVITSLASKFAFKKGNK